MEEPQSLWERLKGHFLPSERNHYRPQSLSRDFLITIVAVVCVVEGFLLTSLFMQSAPGQFAAAVLQGAIVNLTNGERASAGYGALTVNPTLTAAAQAKANDMAAKGYFSHQGPDGKQPWTWIADAGYDYAYAGENLAVRFYDSSDVVVAWMNSPSHRANIVKPAYKEIGIGIAEGMYEGQQTTFVVQFFGTTRAALGIAPSAQKSAPIAPVQAPAPVVPPTSAPSVATTQAVPLATSAPQAPVVVATAEPTVTQTAAPAVPSVPSVEGQSTTQLPTTILRIFNSPKNMAISIMAALLMMLIVALGVAIFVRIHIQPVDMLLSGAVVAAFVFSLIAFNSYILTGATIPESSPAAAIDAVAGL